jgi:hypothetical protein
MSDAQTEGPASEQKWPSWWLLGLQLAALWCLGLVRPLFDVLDSDSAFFVARGNTAGDVLIFAIGVTFLVPLVLTLIEVATRAVSKSAARVVHIIFVVLLAALVALQFARGPFSATFLAFAVSLAIGALVGWAFWKTAGMRSFLSIITPAPFIFLALFLFASPVADIIMPSSGGSTASGESGNATPVVLVIFDELPAATLMTAQKKVDAERYPNFAQLETTSTWYQNHTTVADATFAAVPAILTGKTPPDNRVSGETFPQSVYTMLASNHRVTNIEAITHVCPTSICAPQARGTQSERLQSLFDDLSIVTGRVVLPNELADTLPSVGTDYGGFTKTTSSGLQAGKQSKADANARFKDSPPILSDSLANERLRGVAETQSAINGGGKPPLYVLHVELPHVPWRFGPTGDQYIADGPEMPGLSEDQIWEKNKYLTNLAIQRFTMQMEYGDKALGSIVDKMKKTGLWEKSLFIVTADHGVSFRPGDSRRPVTKTNFPEISNTPLFVKLPGQTTGRVSTAATRSIDILPTIAQVTKTGENLKFDGIPLDAKHTNMKIGVRNGRLRKKLYANFPELMARRDELVAQWTKEFPAGRASIYRNGPNQGLIGKQVSSLPTGSSNAKAKVDNGSLYGKLAPGSGINPIYFSGTIDGAGAGVPLAAAVNGKVVAVGESFQAPGDTRFAIILPPDSLTGSHARVQLFSVSGGSTLAPLATVGR